MIRKCPIFFTNVEISIFTCSFLGIPNGFVTFALGFLSRRFFKMAITGHELFKLETKMLVGGNNRHSNIEKRLIERSVVVSRTIL